MDLVLLCSTFTLPNIVIAAPKCDYRQHPSTINPAYVNNLSTITRAPTINNSSSHTTQPKKNAWKDKANKDDAKSKTQAAKYFKKSMKELGHQQEQFYEDMNQQIADAYQQTYDQMNNDSYY